MHTIVILTDTQEVDKKLIENVTRAFPECKIESRLKDRRDSYSLEGNNPTEIEKNLKKKISYPNDKRHWD